jgi:hypothetical protein
LQPLEPLDSGSGFEPRRALVASDKDNVYHANHGQLGFALKDQRQPNWQEADSELTKAIEIRGPSEAKGWVLYEFSRAVCKINLDEAFKQGLRSSDKTKKAIIADLKAAAKVRQVQQIIANEPDVKKWIELNEISL